jgi:hypothetical protein
VAQVAVVMAEDVKMKLLQLQAVLTQAVAVAVALFTALVRLGGQVV